MGFYGDRGDEELDENSSMGDGFLPRICKNWEDASKEAENAGVRVVKIRTGIVLDATGGALGKMLLPAKLGGGGPIGRVFRRLYVSWRVSDWLSLYSPAPWHLLTHLSVPWHPTYITHLNNSMRVQWR